MLFVIVCPVDEDTDVLVLVSLAWLISAISEAAIIMINNTIPIANST